MHAADQDHRAEVDRMYLNSRRKWSNLGKTTKMFYSNGIFYIFEFSLFLNFLLYFKN